MLYSGTKVHEVNKTKTFCRIPKTKKEDVCFGKRWTGKTYFLLPTMEFLWGNV